MQVEPLGRRESERLLAGHIGGADVRRQVGHGDLQNEEVGRRGQAERGG